jgi:ABC-type branched-subunit amino acid transport system ATPase component/branched-subunit amino acid ABC-type transport system permease component
VSTWPELRQRVVGLPSPVRGLLAVVLSGCVCEVSFGWKGGGHVLGVPVPDGIPVGNLAEGAIAGLLYGLLALGVILVHRANRVINFAQAALGGIPALLGILLIGVEHVPYLVGVFVVLVSAVIVGYVAERVVLKPYLNQSRLILTVATIGIGQLIALGELFLPTIFGRSGGALPAITTPLDSVQVTVTGVVLNGNYLVIVAVTAAVLVSLNVLFRRTRIGLAIRASAENSDRALLLGIPVDRVTTVVWVLATALSAVAAFLRQPIIGTSLGSDIDVNVLLFGLAAAVIAKLESMPVAVVAGIGLGMLDRSAYYGTGNPALPTAVVLPALLLVLLGRRASIGRALDTGVSSFRVASETTRIPLVLRGLPEVVWARRGVRLVTLGLALAAPLIFGTSRVSSLSSVVLTGIVAVSLVVLTGWAGQVSLGQVGIAGVGAAVAGGLATHAHADFLLTLAAAVVAGALVSTLIGLPALRLPGLLLAVVTLAFGTFVPTVLLNRDYFSWLLPDPLVAIQRPVLFGRWDVTSDFRFYYVCLAALGLVLASAYSLRSSRSARVFISQRDNVRASQAYGIGVLPNRLAAFALAGGIAALGGALTAYQQGAVRPTLFPVELSVLAFVTAVVGGITSPAGAVAGAAVYGVLTFDGSHLFHFLDGFGLSFVVRHIDQLGLAGGVLFVLAFFPSGLAGTGQRLRDVALRRVALRRGLRVPSLLADDLCEIATSDSDGGASAGPGHADVPDDALLTVRDLTVGYDGVRVLFGIDLHVRSGEILALLGTNGAGKSTLLKAITGLVPSGGQCELDGEDLQALDATGRVGKGIVMVPGGKGCFPTLSVADHFRAARWLHDGPQVDARQEKVLQWFPQLAQRWNALAGNLSGGEQQQLAVGMAFLLEPTLLVIDELSLGLSPKVVATLLDVVREINAAGTAVVLVEQSVNVALSIAQRAYFLEKGQVRFCGPTAELLGREDVLHSVFLTGAAPAPAKARRRRTAVTVTKDVAPERADPVQADNVPVLAVSDLGVSFGGLRALDGVSFAVHPGEVLGLIGQNGAGKTTVFDLVSGFLPAGTGRVALAGRDMTNSGPDERARHGLGRSFQDARIFSSLTVAENIATALERHLPFRDHLAGALALPDVRVVEEDIAWTVADLVELLNLGDLRDKAVAELSTGSRRIVDIAMALAFEPSVLLLDEPSSGIAQRETEALAPLLRRIRDETGAALLVIEHDIPLIREISDRMLALELGRVIAEGRPEQVLADPAVLAGYLGTDSTTISRSGRIGLLAGSGTGR